MYSHARVNARPISPSAPRLSVVAPLPRRTFEMRWPASEPLAEDLRRRICCIVPCYNVGKLCLPVIRQCLRHAGKVIAVDDGSTDDTPRYLKEAANEAA